MAGIYFLRFPTSGNSGSTRALRTMQLAVGDEVPFAAGFV
jgi:hypothetical protein